MAGGLKEVRERISSVQNTMQITSAMKMVSAAKLRRAQDAITRMRPYAEKLQSILSNVSATLDRSVLGLASVSVSGKSLDKAMRISSPIPKRGLNPPSQTKALKTVFLSIFIQLQDAHIFLIKSKTSLE